MTSFDHQQITVIFMEDADLRADFCVVLLKTYHPLCRQWVRVRGLVEHFPSLVGGQRVFAGKSVSITCHITLWQPTGYQTNHSKVFGVTPFYVVSLPATTHQPVGGIRTFPWLVGCPLVSWPFFFLFSFFLPLATCGYQEVPEQSRLKPISHLLGS